MKSHRRPFSIWRFSVTRGLQFCCLLLALKVFWPELWHRQIDGGATPVAIVFVGMLLINCFFEWAFHRYILHAWTWPWFKRFASGHRHHHSLTPIKLSPGEYGKDRVVINRYPITSPDQYEDSTFPVYALVAFWLIFSPVIILGQLLLPHAPVVLGGYAAVTMSMFSYEIFHSLEHRPYEWWKSAIEHPRYGNFWKAVYGFHHMHHANVKCNEAVGGFFGLPIADWVFGTYYQPEELLLHDRVATAKQFQIPPPRKIIQRLDQWAVRRESAILARKKKNNTRSS